MILRYIYMRIPSRQSHYVRKQPADLEGIRLGEEDGRPAGDGGVDVNQLGGNVTEGEIGDGYFPLGQVHRSHDHERHPRYLQSQTQPLIHQSHFIHMSVALYRSNKLANN